MSVLSGKNAVSIVPCPGKNGVTGRGCGSPHVWAVGAKTGTDPELAHSGQREGSQAPPFRRSGGIAHTSSGPITCRKALPRRRTGRGHLSRWSRREHVHKGDK
jgi:hypothetical protein